MSEERAPAALVVENVTRILPGEVPVTLVESVTLTIDRGEFVVIRGPSGSGKSSLLYLLGLLDRPTRGEVRVEGQATAELGDNALAKICTWKYAASAQRFAGSSSPNRFL